MALNPMIAAAGVNLLGGVLGGRSQERAAASTAQAQLEAAKLAARFRPVGVTTAFGQADFQVEPDYIPQVDPQTGQPVLDASGNPVMVENPNAGFLSEAGYTLSPELQAQQASLLGLLPTALERATGAFATTPYQDLSEQYLRRAQPFIRDIELDPTRAAAERVARMQTLQAPGRAETEERLFSNLAAKGLTGLGVTTGTGATVNPYMAALQEAQAQEDARIAAESLDLARRDIAADLELGGGLLSSAQALEGYSAGRVGQALSPYEALLGQATGLEALGQQALDIGTALGTGERTAASRLASGMSAAAQTRGEAGMLRGQRIAGLFGGVGDIIGQYTPQTPTVSGGLMPPGAGVMMPQQTPSYNPYAAGFNFSLPTPAPAGAFGPYSGGYGGYSASYAAPYTLNQVQPMVTQPAPLLTPGQGATESFYLSP